MKIKIKFQKNKIFTYAFIILIIVNLVIAYFVYNFINNNVYQAYFPDDKIMALDKRISLEDLNTERFQKTVEKIKEKSIINNNEFKGKLFDFE